jgi:hypothetical protein
MFFLRAAAGYKQNDEKHNEAIKDIKTILIKTTKASCYNI